MPHPYDTLPPEAFWRSGVAGTDPDGMPGLYRPRVRLTRQTRIATAGSCFVRHIGAYLRQAGCTLLDGEPAPRAMPAAVADRFGYGQFSGRYGHVHSTRQWLDLLRETAAATPDPTCLWTTADRNVDGFRPGVEPEGLNSAAEVLGHRRHHLARLTATLRQTDVLILTLGLTESWVDAGSGRALPTCPGVIAGQFDPGRHRLHVQTHAGVLADLHQIRTLLHRFQPGMQMLLSLSPVPLTATAGGQHVLVATAGAKATLRAAAGEFVAATADTDYVPSYELLTHPVLGQWFMPNRRDIAPAGVDRVMRMFLAAHGLRDWPDRPDRPAAPAGPVADHPSPGAECEEALLAAFAPPLSPPKQALIPARTPTRTLSRTQTR